MDLLVGKAHLIGSRQNLPVWKGFRLPGAGDLVIPPGGVVLVGEAALDHARGGPFGVADLAGVVDDLAGEAKVGGGGRNLVPVWNEV